MRVRLNTLMAGPKGVFVPGAVIDVPDSVAATLIARGAIQEPEREAVLETATIEPRSERRPGRKRGR